jgi:hypothetical protein
VRLDDLRVRVALPLVGFFLRGRKLFERRLVLRAIGGIGGVLERFDPRILDRAASFGVVEVLGGHVGAEVGVGDFVVELPQRKDVEQFHERGGSFA